MFTLLSDLAKLMDISWKWEFGTVPEEELIAQRASL